MREQVLIVDDEQDVAELLRYNLEKEDYLPIVATSGQEAVNAVQSHDPDVVLLDVMMPELDGWEVCRILRQSSKGQALPIVMLTALSDEDARIRGLTLGADDYITKPFSVRELMLKVRKCIDRRQAIKQFRAREREHETTLRYLVHEVKNSLAAIGGFSSLALKKEGGSRHLSRINTVAVHTEGLLNDLSLLTRLEKEGGTLPTEPIDIVAMVKEAAEMLRNEALKRQVEIIVLRSSPGPVRANRTAVRQVLMNLLSNAVKYNREGGRVLVSFDKGGGRMDVVIRDEGRGIRRDELPRIFDKFYRASGSEQVKGAGLGLYIVKLLAAAMGGSVAVTSAQGAGSMFTASFVRVNAAVLRSAKDVA